MSTPTPDSSTLAVSTIPPSIPDPTETIVAEPLVSAASSAPPDVPTPAMAMTASGVLMPRPSPPASVAGAKRDLRGPKVHDLENGKLPKLHIFDHVVPLQLRETAPLPIRARANPSRSGMNRLAPLPRPSRAEAASQMARRPQSGRPLTDDTRMQVVGAAPMQTHAPSYAHAMYQQPYPQQPPYQQHPYPPQSYAQPPYPQGHVVGYPPPAPIVPYGYPHDSRSANAPYSHPEPYRPDDPAQCAGGMVPQNAEEAVMLWHQLQPSQQAELLRLMQTQQDEPTSPTPINVDADWESTHSDQSKGKSKAITTDDDEDATMDEPSTLGCDMPPPVPIDTLTNSFGTLLLGHVQQSQQQTNELISQLMAEQKDAQERLRNAVAQELRAVYAKVDQLQSPLPLHGQRRTGKSNEATATPQQRTQSPTKRNRAAAAPVTPDMEEGLTQLKSSVRKHLRTMLKYTTWSDLVETQPPLTEQEIKSYGTRSSTVQCTEDAFRIDFVNDWKKLPFNMCARDVFVQNFLKCIKGGAFNFKPAVLALITQAHVESALDSHMEYCRKKYREAYNLQRWDSEDEEDAAKKAKYEEKTTAERKRKAVNSRKKTLLEARLAVVLEQGLSRHALLFDRLLPQNMSGDETDGAKRQLPMVYRVVESRWQSDALKTFMRTLDVMYRTAWSQSTPGQRATRGNPPRTRIARADGRIEDGYPPAGLWRNCYDQQWLRGLQVYQRRALNIIQANYGFDITPESNEDDLFLDDDAMNEGEEAEVEEDL